MSTEEIHDQMQAQLDFCVTKMIEELLETLDEMVEEKHAGLIAWEAKDMCSYHYYTWQDSPVQTDLRVDSKGNAQRVEGGNVYHTYTHTESDRERTVTVSYHRHDLLDAQREDLKGVLTPVRVEPLVQKAPSWWIPALRIVTGTQIAEVKVDRVVLRKKWTDKQDTHSERFEADPLPTPPRPRQTYRYDPAVVLGDCYVLAGWNEDEK